MVDTLEATGQAFPIDETGMGAGVSRDGTLVWPALPGHDAWSVLTIVAGTLIVVQGFETSGYLGDEFDPETRCW